MFTPWSSPNHIPMKSRGPIQKKKQPHNTHTPKQIDPYKVVALNYTNLGGSKLILESNQLKETTLNCTLFHGFYVGWTRGELVYDKPPSPPTSEQWPHYPCKKAKCGRICYPLPRTPSPSRDGIIANDFYTDLVSLMKDGFPIN